MNTLRNKIKQQFTTQQIVDTLGEDEKYDNIFTDANHFALYKCSEAEEFWLDKAVESGLYDYLLSESELSLDELLEIWSVHSPGMWENNLSDDSIIQDWHAVSNNDGIVAYFQNENDAFRFRLDKINGELNGR